MQMMIICISITIPVMIQKLTTQSKGQATLSITALVLLLPVLPLTCSLPLSTSPGMTLGFVAVKTRPSTVPTPPHSAAHLLKHLLLHLDVVFLLLRLQMILVQTPQPSTPHQWGKPDARGSYWRITQNLFSQAPQLPKSSFKWFCSVGERKSLPRGRPD